MFWRKARKIKELKILVNELTAATNTNKITVRIQDQTIADMKKEADAARAEIATLTDELRITKEALAGASQRQAELNVSAGETLARQGEEIEKLQDKILQLEEDLREKDRVAQAEARRASFANLNDYPGTEPPKKAVEEPSPGIGDYSSGQTHPTLDAPDGEWR